MKKLLFVFPVLALLAAGCNSSQQAIVQTPIPVAENTNPVPSPIPTPTQTPTTTDQTANWQTYISSAYHFQIKYPVSWIFNEAADHQYFSIAPKVNSNTRFTLSPINVGRESVFDTGSTVKIQVATFAGKSAKIYSCPDNNSCPAQLAYSKAITLSPFPTGWGQGNEIDYNISKGDESYFNDFEQILQSLKFTK